MRPHITLSPRQLASALAFVALGGGVGTFLRDLFLRIDTTHWYLTLVGGAGWYAQIPWTLMIINIVGVYAVARLLVGRLRAHDPNDLARLLIVTGFYGGFTSYSSLFVSFNAVWHGSKVGAIVVAALAIMCGVGAGWLGVRRRHQ